MTERTSRTPRWSALLAAAALAVVQPASAPATPGDGVVRSITRHAKLHHDCGDGLGSQTQLFLSCGEFPASLPMTFQVNHLLNQVTGPQFTAAVNGAANAWNDAPTAPPAVFTIGGTTTKSVVRDGTNTILWGNPSDCEAPGAAAVACIYYDGGTGAARHRIVEVDVILNYDETWLQATGFDEVTGVATGSAGLANNAWLDVQSALTHELGHAIGLEHIGNQAVDPWFRDLTNYGKHLQTMFAWELRGSTIKRTLDVGDILGLAYIAENT
jgi:hypothetical protein